MNDDILVDLNCQGKPRNWSGRKLASLEIAGCYHRIAETDDRFASKADRMIRCGDYLGFERDADGKLHLRLAYFCKVRLCPMCMWRRTLKIAKQVSDVADRLEVKHPGLRIIFVTYTVQNPSAEDLNPILDRMFKGWHDMMLHSKMKRIIKGWFRGVEVTYNEEEDTYHPHLHALFIVDEEYFRSRDYMESEEWAHHWARSCGFAAHEAQSCLVEAVPPGPNGSRYKMVRELSKYTVKDMNITRVASEAKRDEVVKTLALALHGRRLCAFGGLLKQVSKELGQERLGEGDLVHVEGDAVKVRADMIEGLEIYTWSQGIGNYVREKRIRKSGV